MIDRAGSLEVFFADGQDETSDDVGTALDRFSTRALALDLRRAYGRVPQPPGRLLFFSASLRWQRLQAAEPVSPLDGPPRRARSRRVVARAGGPPRCSARHPRHPRGPVSAFDAIRESGLGDGARHHGVAAPPGSGRSREIRLLTVPPGHDERLRLQSPAERCAVSAAWVVPATRSYTAAVSATIRSTVNRSRTRTNPASPICRRSGSSVSSRTIDRAIA